MFVYVKYACCGGKRVSYVGQSSQDVSLALDASGAGQSHLGCSTRVCKCVDGVHAYICCVQAYQWCKAYITVNSHGVELVDKWICLLNMRAWVYVNVCVWFITGRVAVSMLLGRGLICVPGCELVDGRLSPSHPWSQQQSWGLAVSRRQTRDLWNRKTMSVIRAEKK